MKNEIRLAVSYRRKLLPTFGLGRFEVWLGEAQQIVPRQPFFRHFNGVITATPGAQRLEFRNINILSGQRRSWFFNVDLADREDQKLELRLSAFWGSWLQPRVHPQFQGPGKTITSAPARDPRTTLTTEETRAFEVWLEGNPQIRHRHEYDRIALFRDAQRDLSEKDLTNPV